MLRLKQEISLIGVCYVFAPKTLRIANHFIFCNGQKLEIVLEIVSKSSRFKKEQLKQNNLQIQEFNSKFKLQKHKHKNTRFSLDLIISKFQSIIQ